MNPTSQRFGKKTQVIATPFLALMLTFAWGGVSGDSAFAVSPMASEGPGTSKAAAAKAKVEKRKMARTQAGARVSFSTVKDWGLKAENLVPRGHNPLYMPFKPGHTFIMEFPDHPWGVYRKEVRVLEETEPFDIPGFGKFEAAVIQEEEFFDGVYDQQALNWFAMDKTNNAVYAFGEVSWEIDQIGRKIFAGTWRVGEVDGGGEDSPYAEPGLLMPGTFLLGSKYIFDGHEAEAYGYTENMETGITMTTPAGTFKGCARTREYSLTNPSDVTDKWWCPGIGLVRDTSDGVLVSSSVVPGTEEHLATFGHYHRHPVAKIEPPVAKVDGIAATAIALKEIPGTANSVKIERLGKRNVYVVEIIAEETGAEWDVFVDIETGEVVGKDS